MIKKAELFQKKFNASDKPYWHARLSNLVKIACNHFLPDEADCPSLQILPLVANFWLIELNTNRVADPYNASHEEMYLRFIMNNLFNQKWSPVLNKWLYIEYTEQRYCIENKIPLYAIMTDPNISSTSFKQRMSTDLNELLSINPKDGEDNRLEWFICNLSYSCLRMYKFTEGKWKDL